MLLSLSCLLCEGLLNSEVFTFSSHLPFMLIVAKTHTLMIKTYSHSIFLQCHDSSYWNEAKL